jgi:23S rRNA pseudouridine2605 synthase
MSTKIFVVCRTRVLRDGERGADSIMAKMRGRQRSSKHAGPGRGHIGLGRALSKLGFCSRSQAFEIIRAGRVRLKGEVNKNPEAAVRFGKDRIEVDGAVVESAKRIYWMLNKPRGLVTTTYDERGRETVYSGLPPGLPWMSAVGRLDRASEGLLLFTNDSEWAARITAPQTHVEKTYHVQINAVPEDDLLEALTAGVVCAGGDLLKAKRAARIRAGERNSWIEIVLDEGKNRQIRRMLEARGLEVLRLVRVAMGPLQLGSLEKGQARELSAEERKDFGVR